MTFGVAWALLARWTPRPMHRWRRFVLVLFGARLARDVHVYGRVRVWYPPNLEMLEGASMADDVDCYNMAPIRIGRFAIVSQGAYLCGGTHDIRERDFPLRTRPITIGDEAWIAARAFVGPGVSVGDRAVLGACAVALRDIAPDTIHVGNPATSIGTRVLRS